MQYETSDAYSGTALQRSSQNNSRMERLRLRQVSPRSRERSNDNGEWRLRCVLLTRSLLASKGLVVSRLVGGIGGSSGCWVNEPSQRSDPDRVTSHGQRSQGSEADQLQLSCLGKVTLSSVVLKLHQALESL